MSLLRDYLPRILLTVGVLLGSGFAPDGPAPAAHKKVAVVFLKLGPPYCSGAEQCALDAVVNLRDSVLTPRHSAAAYQGMLNYQMTRYFDENSFNRSHLTFEAIVNPGSPDGWFEAPHSLFYYNEPGTPEKFTADRVFLDALAVAYPVAGSALQDYDMLLVIQNIQAHYGYALTCGSDPGPGNYITCGVSAGPLQLDLGLTTIGENIAEENMYEVAGHELGHLHGLSHVLMGPYDLIGDSDVQTHYSSWSKIDAGWVTGTNTLCLEGPCEITTDLTPLERAGNNVLLIPFVNNPTVEFIGYMVECRAHIGFDQKIPEEGVIISAVDVPADPGLPAKIVLPAASSGYAQAALSPGELFVDSDREITVTYLSRDGVNNCRVQAERGDVTAPDPYIKSDGTGDSGSGGAHLSSRDIWIDSQENGWGTYPATESYTFEGGQEAPTGDGDPFWVEHENRIMFKVRNQGYGPADDVRVNVYVRQPLTVYIPSLDCPRTHQQHDQLVGSVVIDHLEEGGIYFGSIPWTPAVESPAMVTVVIEDYPGELTHSNNLAKEVYGGPPDLQAVPGTSGGLSATLAHLAGQILSVATETNCGHRIPIWVNRFVIDESFQGDWVIDSSPIQGVARADETTEFDLTSLPPAHARPGECGDVGVQVKALVEDMLEPVQAFSFRTCVVERTTLTCQASPASAAPGTNVTVTGAMTPAARDAAIALEYTGPDGKATVAATSLDASGGYRHAFAPNLAGTWQVQAFWQGDNATAPAQSSVCTFAVAASTPSLTLDKNANCRTGPGMDYPVVTSDVKGSVIPVDARSPDSQWLYGRVLGARCWIYAGVGTLNVPVETLPVRKAPPKPTQTPAPVCGDYDIESACLRHKGGCVWVATNATCQAR